MSTLFKSLWFALTKDLADLREALKLIDVQSEVSAEQLSLFGRVTNRWGVLSNDVGAIPTRSDITGFKTSLMTLIGSLENYAAIGLNSVIQALGVVASQISDISALQNIDSIIAAPDTITNDVPGYNALIILRKFYDKAKKVFPGNALTTSLRSTVNIRGMLGMELKYLDAFIDSYNPDRRIYGNDTRLTKTFSYYDAYDYNWVAPVPNQPNFTFSGNWIYNQLAQQINPSLLSVTDGTGAIAVAQLGNAIINTPLFNVAQPFGAGLKVKLEVRYYTSWTEVYSNAGVATMVNHAVGAFVAGNANIQTQDIANAEITTYPIEEADEQFEVLIPMASQNINGVNVAVNHIALTTNANAQGLWVVRVLSVRQYGNNGSFNFPLLDDSTITTNTKLIDLISNADADVVEAVMPDENANKLFNRLYSYSIYKFTRAENSRIIDWFKNAYTTLKNDNEAGWELCVFDSNYLFDMGWWFSIGPFLLNQAEPNVVEPSRGTMQTMYRAFYSRCILELYTMMADGGYWNYLSQNDLPALGEV